jgi:23S rRNA G2069 N7-methylase RlmK/C1962 C5-methylase RlmI
VANERSHGGGEVTRQTPARGAVAAAPYDIRQDDCIRFLRGLAEESVDLIITDPAYSGMNQHMQFGHGRAVAHEVFDGLPRRATRPSGARRCRRAPRLSGL